MVGIPAPVGAGPVAPDGTDGGTNRTSVDGMAFVPVTMWAKPRPPAKGIEGSAKLKKAVDAASPHQPAAPLDDPAVVLGNELVVGQQHNLGEVARRVRFCMIVTSFSSRTAPVASTCRRRLKSETPPAGVTLVDAVPASLTLRGRPPRAKAPPRRDWVSGSAADRSASARPAPAAAPRSC